MIVHSLEENKSGSSRLPGPQSITSLSCSWGPRQRNVEPEPAMQTIVEKSLMDSERKKKAISCSLYEARSSELRHLAQEGIEELICALPDSRMHVLMPRSFTTTATTFGDAPKGSVASYQLKKPPVKSQAVRTTTKDSCSGKTDRGGDGGKVQDKDGKCKITAYFLPLPIAGAAEGITLAGKDWPISLEEARQQESRTRRQQECAE